MCFDIIWQIARMERSGLSHPPPPPLLEGLWYEMHYAVIVPNDGSSSLRRQQYHEDPHGKLLSWLFVVDKSTNWGPVKILASLDTKIWITIMLHLFIGISLRYLLAGLWCEMHFAVIVPNDESSEWPT